MLFQIFLNSQFLFTINFCLKFFFWVFVPLNMMIFPLFFIFVFFWQFFSHIYVIWKVCTATSPYSPIMLQNWSDSRSFVMYCNVLYCTVLYCTVRYDTAVIQHNTIHPLSKEMVMIVLLSWTTDWNLLAREETQIFVFRLKETKIVLI